MSLHGHHGKNDPGVVINKQSFSDAGSNASESFSIEPNGSVRPPGDGDEDDYWTSSTFLRESTVNFDEAEPTLNEGAFRLFGVSNAVSSSLAKSLGTWNNIYDFDDAVGGASDIRSHLSDEIRSLHSEASYGYVGGDGSASVGGRDDDSTASATSAGVDNKRNKSGGGLSAVAARLTSNYFSSPGSTAAAAVSATSSNPLAAGGKFGGSLVQSTSPSSSLVGATESHSNSAKKSGVQSTSSDSVPAAEKIQQRHFTPPQHAVSVDAAGAASAKAIVLLNEELRQLRKTLDYERRQRYARCAPRDTISQLSNINSGNDVPPVCVSQYQSLRDKEQLLDEALQRRDYDAIIPVIFHLKHTLNPTIFTAQLRQRPEALQCYINFLKADGKYEQCIDLLESTGRSYDAGMLEFELALRANNSHKCCKMLEKCSTAHFSHNVSAVQSATNHSIHANAYCNEYKTLIELQRPLKHIDVRSSLITTVFNACRTGHFDEPDNMFTSPAFFRTKFRLSAKQYDWTAARALAAGAQWDKLQAFFVERGSWLNSSTTVRCNAVPLPELVGTLFRAQAPPEVLATYLRFLDDAQVRAALAEKCGCYGVYIDAAIQLKDRAMLLQLSKKSANAQLKVKLLPQEHKHLQQTLANPSIKWNS